MNHGPSHVKLVPCNKALQWMTAIDLWLQTLLEQMLLTHPPPKQHSWGAQLAECICTTPCNHEHMVLNGDGAAPVYPTHH